MNDERMELTGLDRLRYFIPTVICGYLAGVCVVLIITSAFLASVQNAVAVAAAAIFGLSLSAGMGFLFWNTQHRDLSYQRFTGSDDPFAHYAAVRTAALAAGWVLLREDVGRRLDAQTSVLLLSVGERVAVRFRGRDVLVASICDPSVGFSLVGRRHCAAHRDLVRHAVMGTALRCAAATPASGVGA